MPIEARPFEVAMAPIKLQIMQNASWRCLESFAIELKRQGLIPYSESVTKMVSEIKALQVEKK